MYNCSLETQEKSEGVILTGVKRYEIIRHTLLDSGTHSASWDGDEGCRKAPVGYEERAPLLLIKR